jgi:hypothetical protein
VSPSSAAATEVIRSTAAATEVIRSIAALDPTLQATLARVITRVRDETGHEATVGETYRGQDRQNDLFAQGRSAPGPVVTWTQASKHTQGRAVDLVLDGGTAGPEAYAALQRIAKEEGLHTLGPRDPGHLELPASASPVARAVVSAVAAAKTVDVPTEAAAQVSMSRFAHVARVASVDRPAPVARVATVASVATGHIARPTGGRSQESAQHSDSGESGAQGNPRGGYGPVAVAGAFSVREAAATPAPSINAAAVASTASAERVARVLAAVEDAAPRALSQISLSVDAGSGATDRIQVALRGSALSATIDAADPRVAHAMSTRTNELARALTRDGVEVESVRVRSIASVIAPTATAPTRESSDSSTNSRSERGDTWQRQADRQRSEDDRRRNQQRDERGGKSQ